PPDGPHPAGDRREGEEVRGGKEARDLRAEPVDQPRQQGVDRSLPGAPLANVRGVVSATEPRRGYHDARAPERRAGRQPMTRRMPSPPTATISTKPSPFTSAMIGDPPAAIAHSSWPSRPRTA